MNDAPLFLDGARDRDADKADIRARVDDDAILGKRADDLEDELDFAIDVGGAGLDQRFGLVAAMAVDDEAALDRFHHRKISYGEIRDHSCTTRRIVCFN